MAPSVVFTTALDSTVPTTYPQASDLPYELGFDPSGLKAKYAAEREKRLHQDGNDQYRSIDGALSNDMRHNRALDFSRDPVELDPDVVIIGGGYGGQLVAVRLIEQGINNFCVIEKGGDFGGTWYWNEYPGAQCDIDSYVYMPLLEETKYIPTEKYAHADELRDHAVRIGRHYNLYTRALFQTEVLGLRWDDSKGLWSVETNHNDSIRARFVIPVAGPLHKPKIPGMSGIKSFEGHSFHSSCWDYDYTGGRTSGGLTKLTGKRVGIIGTGATAVQIVPHLGEWAKEVFVFQRTPSSIDVRNNAPTDGVWAKTLTDGWQDERMENFNAIISGVYQATDLVADCWTRTFRDLRRDSREMKDNEFKAHAAALQLADFRKMESLRARVDSIVKNQECANSLKPWYNYICKRPCAHDEYLQTFNRCNVHLVDTKGRGVEAITAKGAVADGKEYELDCLVYATGFELATDWSHSSGMEIYGRNGLTVTEKWRDGASTFQGWASRGFPNCLFLGMTQAALSPNFMYVTNKQAKHFAYVISQCQARGIRSIDATADAEDKWVKSSVATGEMRSAALKECTPSFYNNEGKLTLRAARNAPYGGGVIAFFEILNKWREEDKLDGLDITNFTDEK